MQSYDRVLEATRLWLEIAEPFGDDELGLVWVERAHTGGRGTPEGMERYHSVAQDGLEYVLALLATDDKLDVARRGIDTALGCQETDPDSRQYGNFRWYVEDERVVDGNGGFFTNYLLLTIHFHYADKLSAEQRGRLKESFRHSLAHFARPTSNVSYTNAFLGNAACGAIMAEMLADEEALCIVRDNWEQFFRENFTRGICERLSPCYYGVSLPVLALTVGRVRDRRIRRIARETFDVMLQELCFFEQRTPIPARRTYNACGEAWNYHFVAWPLGLNPMTPRELQGRGWLAGWFLPVWHAFDDAGTPIGPQAQPAPRILEGRFTDDGAVYSYFHPDFTLGSFTRYPEVGAHITSPYEVQAGFSGDGQDLGLIGMAAQFPDGSWTGLPWRDELRDAGPDWRSMQRAFPIDWQFITHQHENMLIWLADIDRFHADVRSLGAMVRVPQFTGEVLDEAGRPLQGAAGRLDDGWVFLITERARFGIRPLTRLTDDLARCAAGPASWRRLPADPDTVRPYPGPWHVHPDPSSVQRQAGPSTRFGLYLPSFEGGEPREVCMDNIANGVVIVAAGRRAAPERFMSYCRNLDIADEWTAEGYVRRSPGSARVRSVTVRAPDVDLRLRYDYALNRVLERSVCGVPCVPPSARSSVRFVSETTPGE